jgi:hypothetical protein
MPLDVCMNATCEEVPSEAPNVVHIPRKATAIASSDSISMPDLLCSLVSPIQQFLSRNIPSWPLRVADGYNSTERPTFDDAVFLTARCH